MDASYIDERIAQMAARLEKAEVGLVRLQQHRDAWRAYAYGKGAKPDDFLDGNMVDRPETKQEATQWERDALRDALRRTRDYIRTAMRPTSIAAAASEGIYERAHRCGLEHGLNAINAEFAKCDESQIHKE